MLSMALRLSENSGKQCIALRYIESSTIRSCVVDNFEKKGEGERQTLDKSDCLDYLSVSHVSGALWATMASRITVTEIRPRWGRERKRERGGRKERRGNERGKESEEWRIGTWLEESSVITASQQPVWSWGMAEGCKAFEADNPFVMITHVFQCARADPPSPIVLWAADGSYL